MAYDPEARRQSNAAMIVGIVGLVIAAGAALAFFANRSGTPETPPTTTIVQGATTSNSALVNASATPGPTATPIVITITPQPNAVTGATTAPATVTRNTTIIRNTRIIEPPAVAPTTAPAANGGNTNVTVNNIVPTTAPATGSVGGGAVAPTAATGTATANTAADVGNSASVNVAAGY